MTGPDIERLVQRLVETEQELQALLSDEVDAVVNPASATPILLGRAQRALAESEARYRELIARCPALVCELLPDGRIAFANDAFRSLLGFEPAALIGDPLWEALAADGHEHAARCFHAALERGDVANHELLLRSAAGEPRWILWTTANRYDADGFLDCAVAFGIDITARKQAEEAALQLREAENARVRAEAANKAKTEFLAVMSHELRTPLNAIGGYAELMELGIRGPITAEQRSDLARIQQSQRHLLGLINGVLNYARVEAGAVHYALKEVQVEEALAACEALVMPQLRSRDLTLEREPCGDDLRVRADEEKLQQILLNLLSNAVKFTEPGGTVTIRCSGTHDGVCIEVTDNGIGIAEDQLSRVFEPFVQVDAKLTRTREGTGLGLAISRDLARGMGGDITATSEPGVGSTFRLVLPRA
ncbi:MAG TPA: PAS domain-containing sensor histidine kinase [Gemmatimonadaceae bacterium]|nr:PAS domain-containing sensor histidine kinase [Gemmatimonadaceae bacterium]